MPPPRAFQINPPLTHTPLLSSVRRESSRSNASKRSDNDTDDDDLAMKVFRRSGAPYADFHPFWALLPSSPNSMQMLLCCSLDGFWGSGLKV